MRLVNLFLESSLSFFLNSRRIDDNLSHKKAQLSHHGYLFLFAMLRNRDQLFVPIPCLLLFLSLGWYQEALESFEVFKMRGKVQPLCHQS
ncbi:hypothetical protein K457DRAFT_688167 [Linnemannia elongata AG-77]|uniref:Uncharacterized protein n=1 Tax=Linnemannia elongata AG-77 TaxID=1314771 RepID=A0A197JQA0_9FUNG|nr:hypothetical protein K457DRAFT_688167 [Linnemannia elongata AG-77]